MRQVVLFRNWSKFCCKHHMAQDDTLIFKLTARCFEVKIYEANTSTARPYAYPTYC